MTPSAAAVEAARRLWSVAAGDARGPEETAAAAERLCARLHAGLAPWIGGEGSDALLDRALGLTRDEHPAVDELVSSRGGDPPAEEPARQRREPSDLAAAMEALVAVLIHVLGRIVGEDLGVRLVEQAATQAGTQDEHRNREGT